MESQWVEGMKFCSPHLSHMTKMVEDPFMTKIVDDPYIWFGYLCWMCRECLLQFIADTTLDVIRLPV